jgi:hypothetical protein
MKLIVSSYRVLKLSVLGKLKTSFSFDFFLFSFFATVFCPSVSSSGQGGENEIFCT